MIIAIVLTWLLMSEGFLVKHFYHYSRLKYLQENTSVLKQRLHWVCSFHASAKVLKVLQVALREIFFFSCLDNFLILNLIGFSQDDLPGVSMFISTQSVCREPLSSSVGERKACSAPCIRLCL